MSTRTRLSLYMLAGIFLAYEGFKLIKETMGNKPENGTAFLVVGVVFLVGGIAFFLKAVRDYISGGYFYPDDPDDAEENPEQTDAAANTPAEREENGSDCKNEESGDSDEGKA